MNKYYTPDIEEFCVGFEFETRKKDLRPNLIYTDVSLYEWRSLKLSSYSFLEDDYSTDNEYRVKYLDDADIEESGFRYIMDSYAGYYTNDKINIAWYWNQQGLEISQVPDKNGWGGKKIFSGKIKNKNELIKLLKQLEIN